MNRQTSTQTAMFVFLVALTAAGRIVSKDWETWNFTPLAAAVLFAGFFFNCTAIAAAVPIVVMTISNLILFRDQPFWGYGSWQMLLIVYAALLIPLAFRPLLRNRLTATRVVAGAVGSSLLFFLVTNLGDWYYRLTEHTPQTLLQNYIDALPFLRGTLLGDLTFSALLFGGYVLAVHFSPAAETAPVAVKR